MAHADNPWVTRRQIPDAAASPRPPASPLPPPTGPGRPQPGAFPPAPGGLTLAQLPPGLFAPWWWLGCHGGAGVSTLERAFAGYGARDAGRSWPCSADRLAASSVVLVARTHFHGLTAAQAAARQWAAGQVPGVHLAGLVLIADAPGRMPKALAEFASLVAGGVHRCWRIGWVEACRFGEQLEPGHPALAELSGLPAALTNGAIHGA